MSSSPASSSTSNPNNLITYRFEEELVYVGVVPNYKDALDIVVKEFPILSEVDRERLTLSTHATMNGARRTVRISESGWAPTSAKLLRGEVIDVTLKPPRSAESLVDAPPQYLEVPDVKMGTIRRLRRARRLPLRVRARESHSWNACFASNYDTPSLF
ncbi:hypothetical protein BDZ89DRAFT_1025669 [Hymenopellis radicata]|nr:hypothetical protein BDZ89DRAFT_1025669 [Hymenopellis radicata]